MVPLHQSSWALALLASIASLHPYDAAEGVGVSFLQKSYASGKDNYASAMTWNDYHESDALLARIKQLEQGGNCRQPLTVEWKADKVDPEKKLFVARLGKQQKDFNKRIFLVANEHARERITSEVALRFIEKACEPVNAGNNEWYEMLGNVSITIVPITNLAGRRKVDKGDKCLRYTVEEEGSIDLNRNMDVDFRPSSDHGEIAFSTYQTRILRSIASEESPLAYVDLHSGARSLMVSWGARDGVTPDYPDQANLLEKIRGGYCTDCEIGSNRLVIDYINEGEIIDHMYAKQRIKYSTLWEVYKGSTGLECETLFNPPKHELKAVADNWADALLEFARLVDTNVNGDERSIEGALQMEAIPPENFSSLLGPGSLVQKVNPFETLVAVTENTLTT
jgi:hypothetical protein